MKLFVGAIGGSGGLSSLRLMQKTETGILLGLSLSRRIQSATPALLPFAAGGVEVVELDSAAQRAEKKHPFLQLDSQSWDEGEEVKRLSPRW